MKKGEMSMTLYVDGCVNQWMRMIFQIIHIQDWKFPVRISWTSLKEVAYEQEQKRGIIEELNATKTSMEDMMNLLNEKLGKDGLCLDIQDTEFGARMVYVRPQIEQFSYSVEDGNAKMTLLPYRDELQKQINNVYKNIVERELGNYYPIWIFACDLKKASKENLPLFVCKDDEREFHREAIRSLAPYLAEKGLVMEAKASLGMGFADAGYHIVPMN
jgi:hypothetical protein